MVPAVTAGGVAAAAPPRRVVPDGGDEAEGAAAGLPSRLRLRLRRGRLAPMITAAAVLVVLVGVTLRFAGRGPLWLDEAQSVAIARLPLHGLTAALRQDGSPPLYYLLLHAWMRLGGTGTVWVRALSGVLSVLTLPLVWRLGRRLGGSALAVSVLLLTAANPFVARYATETRMYALVVLLTAAGGLALLRVLTGPGALPVLALASCTGLLLLTHYWTLFLLAAVGLGLLAGLVRPRHRRACGRALLGVAAGGLLLLPWLPDLLFQLRHTGAPWAPPAPYTELFAVVSQWDGGTRVAARLLLVVTVVLALLGLAGRPLDRRRVVIDLGGEPTGRSLAWLALASVMLGLAVSLHGGQAFSVRYTSVAVLPFLLLVARGAACLRDVRVRAAVLAAASVLGLLGAQRVLAEPRTQAGVVAAALRAGMRPGDVVAYCPDQAGPAVSRLLPANVRQVVYPTFGPVDRVDWVDYAARNAAGRPAAFGRRLSTLAGRHAVWLVYHNLMPTFGTQCQTLAATLAGSRGTAQVVLAADPAAYENEWLLRYGPTEARAGGSAGRTEAAATRAQR